MVPTRHNEELDGRMVFVAGRDGSGKEKGQKVRKETRAIWKNDDNDNKASYGGARLNYQH